MVGAELANSTALILSVINVGRQGKQSASRCFGGRPKQFRAPSRNISWVYCAAQLPETRGPKTCTAAQRSIKCRCTNSVRPMRTFFTRLPSPHLHLHVVLCVTLAKPLFSAVRLSPPLRLSVSVCLKSGETSENSGSEMRSRSAGSHDDIEFGKK